MQTKAIPIFKVIAIKSLFINLPIVKVKIKYIITERIQKVKIPKRPRDVIKNENS